MTPGTTATLNKSARAVINAGFAALARCTIVYTIESCPHFATAHCGAKGSELAFRKMQNPHCHDTQES